MVLVWKNTLSWRGKGGVSCGRRAKKLGNKGKTDTWGMQKKNMREDLTPGRHTGKEGYKRGERTIQIERDGDTKRERECAKEEWRKENENEEAARGSGVSDVQRGHSTAASSLVWPWWDHNMSTANRYPGWLRLHMETQLILHVISRPFSHRPSIRKRLRVLRNDR